MNTDETLAELQQKHPVRPSGSTGVSSVLEEIKLQSSTHGGTAAIQKIPVYRFRTSILVYTLGSLAALALSLAYPIPGLIIETLLWILLIREIIRPTLAKVKPGKGENLVVTIPARSKEFQKIFFITDVSTDNFIDQPPNFSTGLYLGLVCLIGFYVVLLQLLNLWLKTGNVFLMSLLPLLVLFCFIFSGKKQSGTGAGLANCAVLLELEAILTKLTPLTTTVTIIFSGSRSLNSGVQGIENLFKSCPELTYVIELLETTNQQIEIVTGDGVGLSKPSDPLLIAVLKDVAAEKAIPVQPVKMKEISGVYPLKFKKLNVVSIANPGDATESNSNKKLRELLIGLIRKLDH
jgi:hypothetical protein